MKKQTSKPIIEDKPKTRIQNIFEYFKNKKKEKIDYLKTQAELKETTKINLNEFRSDLRFFKVGFWNKLASKIWATDYCLVILHYPQDIDVIRYYKMPKPFVVEINNKRYLFSPKAFRYINGKAKLEFYVNIPFAIIHHITDKFTPPTLDAEAFESVMRSKHIQDASTIKDENNVTPIMIIVIVAIVLCIILNIICLVNIQNILKLVTPH